MASCGPDWRARRGRVALDQRRLGRVSARRRPWRWRARAAPSSLLARRRDRLDAVAERVRRGRRAGPRRRGDVTADEDVARAVAETLDIFGQPRYRRLQRRRRLHGSLARHVARRDGAPDGPELHGHVPGRAGGAAPPAARAARPAWSSCRRSSASAASAGAAPIRRDEVRAGRPGRERCASSLPAPAVARQRRPPGQHRDRVPRGDGARAGLRGHRPRPATVGRHVAARHRARHRERPRPRSIRTRRSKLLVDRRRDRSPALPIASSGASAASRSPSRRRGPSDAGAAEAAPSRSARRGTRRSPAPCDAAGGRALDRRRLGARSAARPRRQGSRPRGLRPAPARRSRRCSTGSAGQHRRRELHRLQGRPASTCRCRGASRRPAAATRASRSIGDPTLSIEEAARRRDFTINAISWDPLTRRATSIRSTAATTSRAACCASSIRRTFGDDSLRVLRALQFAARFECTARSGHARDSAAPSRSTICRPSASGARSRSCCCRRARPSIGLQLALRPRHRRARCGPSCTRWSAARRSPSGIPKATCGCTR